MDEEHRKLLELEKSLLEQHAPEQLSAMFRLERGAAEGGRASRSAARIFSSAAENSTAAGATAERDNTSQLIHSELLRQHRDTPMSNNITLTRDNTKHAACTHTRARARTHTHAQPKNARNARCISW